MSITEIVIFSGVATTITMIAVTPWTDILLMVWGATAGTIDTAGTTIRTQLEETGSVGYFFSKALGFIPGFAITRLAVNEEARNDVRACSKQEVFSFMSFLERVRCGTTAVFWGKTK